MRQNKHPLLGFAPLKEAMYAERHGEKRRFMRKSRQRE
jgi:hypothetical protein